MWILSNMRFSKCEFCQKWDFHNVNFWLNWGFLPQCVQTGKKCTSKSILFLWISKNAFCGFQGGLVLLSEKVCPWDINVDTTDVYFYDKLVENTWNPIGNGWRLEPEGGTLSIECYDASVFPPFSCGCNVVNVTSDGGRISEYHPKKLGKYLTKANNMLWTLKRIKTQRRSHCDKPLILVQKLKTQPSHFKFPAKIRMDIFWCICINLKINICPWFKRENWKMSWEF